MPQFDSASQPQQVLKVLYMGDTGAGKTGSTAALAAAGYNVRILDLDNGVELLGDFMLNPKSIYRNASPGHWTAEQCHGVERRMSYVTITETINLIQGKAIPKGDCWTKLNRQLENWKDGELDLGNVGTWGPRDVLVLDGLSKASRAALNFQLAMNGRIASGKPEQGDWGLAQGIVENFISLLASPQVPCHVIVVCHVAYIERDDKVTRGYPQTIGQALSPKVGQNFNHTLLARSSGQGTAVRRKIITTTTGVIDLKTSAPLRVKGEYDLETGLADYFRDVLGEMPRPEAAAAPAKTGAVA